MKRGALTAFASTAVVLVCSGQLLAAGDTMTADSVAADKIANDAPNGTDTILTGSAAFGGWQDSNPGVWRLIKPADLPAPFATRSASNAPGMTARPADAKPKVLNGFSVSLVASDFQQPRVIATAPNGDLFVADSATNEIRVLRVAAGEANPTEETVFASNLNRPYGIAFYPLGPNPQWVYVGNTDSVVRFPYTNGDLKASGRAEVIVPSLPTRYHWTRDIAFSQDSKKLFVAVGSGSNIAEDVNGAPSGGVDQFAKNHPLGAVWGAEADRADVLMFNPDGSAKQVFATGIRNCSGLTIQPQTGDLWCVTNERDGLGDNLPPDYATRVQQAHFYGWPWFYIGDHQDPRAPLKGQRPDLANQVTVPDVLFQAHSAPLNIAFYDGNNFPAEYKGDAFVAMHGSWNRGKRTGYKIVRLKFANGQPTGAYEDFVTGFVLGDDNVWGRPVGVTVGKDGSLFFTEDGSGTVWRVASTEKPS
jgi:glucose/arabinose dehydrogenase